MTENIPSDGKIGSALIIVKQTFKELAEASGDEQLLLALTATNPNADRIIASDRSHRETLVQVIQILERLGVEAKCINRAPGEHFEVNEELVITIGGDGTFLDASHSILTDVPVLGVNSAPLSSFGNFCPVDKDTVEALLTRIVNGKVRTVPLTRLRVRLDGQSLPTPVLNEAFISHKSPAGTTRYMMEVKGGQTVLQKSSGLIVSTPSGTTGLNRSAKGSLLQITAKGFKYHNLAAFIEPGKPYYEEGKLSKRQKLTVYSEMMEGLIFLDGQHICYPFMRGSKVVIDTGAPVLNAFVNKHRHHDYGSSQGA